MTFDPVIREHQEWLGFVQPVGLVVSPSALKNAQARVARNVSDQQQILLRHTRKAIDWNGNETRKLNQFSEFAKEFWGWEDGDFAKPPDGLCAVLQEYNEILRPEYAVPGVKGESEWLILIWESVPESAWEATPQARFERLLREANVPIGILTQPESITLAYAPRGETAGHITFPIQAMCETAGRPIVAALHLLLNAQRLFSLPKDQRLPAILQASRRYQNEVSIKLAGQVLIALNELTRGFNEAARNAGRKKHDGAESGTHRTPAFSGENPENIYGGLLSTLMRFVFLLYAEDRDLMANDASGAYHRHYSLIGLHEKLREDAAAYPDTMDQRFGAWAQFLTLSRLVHDGGGHGTWQLPPRRGRLFDPDAYPFLEGRPPRSQRGRDEKITPPAVSDGVLYRVLEYLLYLDGERISYRALDVEQIGSVYEAMMGFTVESARGVSIGLKPDHVVINLETLLEQAPADRKKWLKENVGWEPSERAAQAVKNAGSTDDILSALSTRISSLYFDRERGALCVARGDYFLQPTEERRRSGSHYTPRSLTEPIVRTTLDPALQRLGADPTPEQILDLKVCDPAMGSGAFLVEACRYLAEALVKAWAIHKATPEIPTDQDPLLHARRIVAQRCLYGVDKNHFAVDLAKLSLWLATFAKDHPFTFLDHSFRHGDSLVGVSFDQMIDALGEGKALFRKDAEARIANAMAARQSIFDAVEHSPYEQLETKNELAFQSVESLRDLGDAIVAAFFLEEKAKDRLRRRHELINAYEKSRFDEVADAVNGLQSGEYRLQPFHWQTEFPEVFAQGGFVAVISNPPFAGGRKISDTLGKEYLDWLKTVHEQSHGNGDLVAHFFRRAFTIVRSHGCLGLIATNTIAQGDTRSTGLRWICTHGGTIFHAQKRLKWPGEAAVVVSVVHVCKGVFSQPFILDNRRVNAITAYLVHAGGHENPKVLAANAGKSFIGNVVLGMGFTFDDTGNEGVASPLAEMERLISSNPRNSARIFPFIGGEELNNSPTLDHHRYIINFEDWPLCRRELDIQWKSADAEQRRSCLSRGAVPMDYSDPVAEDFPELLEIVRLKVKPERDKCKGDSYARLWWQFARRAVDLKKVIREQGLRRVLAVNCGATPHLSFAFLPTEKLYSHTLALFSITHESGFAVMQSRVHEIWSRLFGSSMKDDLRYTPTDCFETFPFPPSWQEIDELKYRGEEYYQYRAGLMARLGQGLTKTYNRFHNKYDNSPEIWKLRELHARMDRAVLDAYGWTDLVPVHDFILDYEEAEEDEGGPKRKRKEPWRYRWRDEDRDEVLARLLELNRERAQHDSTLDAGKKSSKAKAAVPANVVKRKKTEEVRPTLYSVEDV